MALPLSPSAASGELPDNYEAAEILRDQACCAIPKGYSAWERCHRLDTRMYSPLQLQALNSSADRLVVWGCNRFGKTFYLVDDTVLRLVGRHPMQRKRPPLRVGLGGKSWVQMASTIRALWEAVDPRWFRMAIRYEGGQLKGQRYAIYDLVDGPGKGGQLCLATNEQGADAIQGWEVDAWDQDEPLSEAFYGELVPRLLTTRGTLRLGFTPRLGVAGEAGERLQWFWDLVDAGQIAQIQVPMTVDNLTLQGPLFKIPRITEAQIRDFEASLPGPEREMRMGRSRVPVFTDRVFTCFGDHLVDAMAYPRGGNVLVVGIDHGAGAGRQRACALAAVMDPEPEIWCLDEAASDGRTGPEQDARDIADMLVRLTGASTYKEAVSQVDAWIGDRYHAGDALGGEKSNYLLQVGFARLLGLLTPSANEHEKARAVRALPEPLARMRTPRKWEGSVWDNARTLNDLMRRSKAHFHPRCKVTLEGLKAWRGRMDDPEKDACDAYRYGSIGFLESPNIQRRAA